MDIRKLVDINNILLLKVVCFIYLNFDTDIYDVILNQACINNSTKIIKFVCASAPNLTNKDTCESFMECVKHGNTTAICLLSHQIVTIDLSEFLEAAKLCIYYNHNILIVFVERLVNDQMFDKLLILFEYALSMKNIKSIKIIWKLYKPNKPNKIIYKTMDLSIESCEFDFAIRFMTYYNLTHHKTKQIKKQREEFKSNIRTIPADMNFRFY